MTMSGNTTSPAQRASSLLQAARDKMPHALRVVRSSRVLWPVINLMSLLVWIFSMVGTFHCTFIMIAYIDLVEERGTGYSSLINNNNNDTVTRSNSNWPDHPIGVGLYSTSVYDLNANLLGCVSYYGTTDQFDGSFRAARAFGMMGALATTLGLIFVSLVTLFIEHITIKYSLWQMSRWLFFAAFICQLLTFLAFGRNICNRIDRECKPGPAAELSVFNLFLLCIQSALIYVVPAPNMPLFLLQKEKPMSIIEIGNDGFEINDKHQSSARKNQQQESNIRMENLSIEKSSSSISSQQQQQSPDDNSKNADLWRTGSDLESDDSNGNHEGLPQPVSIVMEGIECVEADHRRRHPKTKWQQFQEQYHKAGKRKGIWIALGLMLCLSWIFTIVGTSRCTFLLVGAKGQDRLEFSGLGLFNRAYYMNHDVLGCIAYPPATSDGFDSPFEAGRAFAIFNMLFMTISFVSYVVLNSLFEPSRKKEMIWFALTQIPLPCALLSQLLVFSAFKTEMCTNSDSVDCTPGVAGIVAILNVFLQLPLAVMIFAVPSPTRPLFRLRTPPPRLPAAEVFPNMTGHNRRQQNSGPKESYDFDDNVRVRSFSPEEVTENIEMCHGNITIDEKDGKRITTKEVKNPDGSITITTIVEEDYQFTSNGTDEETGEDGKDKKQSFVHRKAMSLLRDIQKKQKEEAVQKSQVEFDEGAQSDNIHLEPVYINGNNFACAGMETAVNAGGDDNSNGVNNASQGSDTEYYLSSSDDGSTFNTGDGAINYDPSVVVDHNGKVFIR